MPANRLSRPQAWRTIAPWISASVAALTAAVLLSQFIDTLHVSIQRGEALRAAQAAPAHAQPPSDAIRMADTGSQLQD
jgi:hypothetical protein